MIFARCKNRNKSKKGGQREVGIITDALKNESSS
jgi:hypothetical protein